MAAVVVLQLTWALLLLCVTIGRPSPASEAEEVPEPFNLMVNSYNLNTTLHWDYNRMEMKPYFCVEIHEILGKIWKAIETCQNISHRYCDLTNEIDSDPLYDYKVRVKALVGTKISNAVIVEFSLSSVGIFGPPELKVLKREEKIVEIEITHPKVPSIHETELERLNYIVYYGNDTMVDHYFFDKAKDCDSLACKVTFSISDQETYCFSAEGTSNFFLGMKMEKSKEVCFPDERGISIQAKRIIIGVTVGFLAILAISCFIIARWTKARSSMPQSLNSVESTAAYVQMPTDPRDNVSTTPNEPTVEEITCMKEKVEKDTDVSADSVSKESTSTDPGYHSSNELKSSERDYQSNSSSYFHTDSSASGNNSTDTPLLEKDESISKHAPEPPKPLTNSFGYDKPHFPK